LAEVLSRDPALTAKVLRIVNSPYYGAGREITTMPQAVMTLGMRAVSALALSTSIYDLSGKWQVTIDRQRFWRHSLEVAMAARMIARESGYAYPETRERLRLPGGGVCLRSVARYRYPDSGEIVPGEVRANMEAG
jgi:HD-like signal output (HDOD) protein